MSDSLDKFVLQYEVQMKDAITRLEELTQKVKKTNEEANKGSEGFKKFAKKGIEDIKGMVPGLGRVTSSFGKMKGGIIAATVALVALGVVMKTVARAREEYAKQRETGFRAGMQPLDVEINQRRMSRLSGGSVRSEEARSGIESIAAFQRSMFEDYTKLGRENIIGRKMGVSDSDKSGTIKSVDQFTQELSKSFAKMTAEQAQGYGQLLGLSANYVDALRKQASETEKASDISFRDAARTQEAHEAMDSLSRSLGGISEAVRKSSDAIANMFLPAIAKVFEWISKGLSYLPKTITGFSDLVSTAKEGTMGIINAAADAIKNGNGFSDGIARMHKGAAESAKAAAEKNEKTGEDFAREQKNTNQQARQTAAQVNKDVNMFSAAVSTFARAIDEQQAWAAWAGDLGRANGIAGASASGSTNGVGRTTPGGRTMGSTPFDAIYEEASKKHGVPTNLLKQITDVESKFNPRAVSPQGAVGLMQLMPEISKTYGISDAKDPKQNIMGGARLMAELLKRTGGDVDTALKMYHGGLDKSNWGPKTMAYADKVLGSNGNAGYVGKGIGQSKESLNKRFVMENIANQLGVPLGQIQHGGVNKGDVDWARSQIEAGLNNNIIKQRSELQNPYLTQSARGKLMQDLNANTTGLASMVKFGGGASDVARPGERSLTIGERAIQIIVNGADSPKATAEAVKTAFAENLKDLVYGSTTSLKY